MFINWPQMKFTVILLLFSIVGMASVADSVSKKHPIKPGRVAATKAVPVAVLPTVIQAWEFWHGHKDIIVTPIIHIYNSSKTVQGNNNCTFTYHVISQITGHYAITLHVSSVMPGLSMRVLLDDVDVTGTMVIPVTGSWKNFVDVTSKKVPVTAGIHKINIVWDETPGINFLLPRLLNVKIAEPKPIAIRINAGDYMDYTDSEGNVWQPDTGFVDGECVERGEGVKIKNSKDVRIYRTEHFGMSRFAIKVPNGDYIARLHFAETFDDRRPGSRIFKMVVQEVEFPKFDLIAEAGGCYRALIKTVPVKVTNGEFCITFFAPNMPSVTINGIELLELVVLSDYIPNVSIR